MYPFETIFFQSFMLNIDAICKDINTSPETSVLATFCPSVDHTPDIVQLSRYTEEKMT